MKILIVTAHPDDMENGMGGTIPLLLNDGHEIQLVVATTDTRNPDARKSETCEGMKRLGINLVPIFLDIPDLGLEDDKETRRIMGYIMHAVQPDIVFSLWPVDVHPDHRAVAALTIGPFMQRGVNTEVFCFELNASGRTAQSVRPQSLAFRPTHYVDITSSVKIKRRAMDAHVTQDPDGMWLGIGSMNRNRGTELNYSTELPTYAEGFVRLTRHGHLHPDLRHIFKETPFNLPRGIGADWSPEAIGLSAL